jgi:hypothetical protein
VLIFRFTRLGEAWKLRQPPRVADYAASDRRIVFNEDGIFRRYKALDIQAHFSSFRGARNERTRNPEVYMKSQQDRP